jgi:hypothetical protein
MKVRSSIRTVDSSQTLTLPLSLTKGEATLCMHSNPLIHASATFMNVQDQSNFFGSASRPAAAHWSYSCQPRCRRAVPSPNRFVLPRTTTIK